MGRWLAMPRRPRIHYPGAIYHVIARGNNQKNIFVDAADYLKYLFICKDYLSSLNYYVLAYALMGNHLHILIEVCEQPLSQFMKIVQQRYTQYFNKKYKTSGHVFQGRYKAFLVNTEQYLRQVISYIHYNPFRAGLEALLGLYPWTGHYEILKKKNFILAEERMLSYFDHKREKAYNEYLHLMQNGSDDEEDINKFYLNSTKKTAQRQVYESDNMWKRISFEELIDAIANSLQVEKKLLLSSSKRKGVVKARKVSIFFARHHLNLPGNEMSEMFGLSQETIAKSYQDVLRTNDPEMGRIVELIKRKFKSSNLTPG
ncbi:MAG: transposase [Firmicutes bacterium]|nr:transposase [Bacillota bacterium]